MNKIAATQLHNINAYLSGNKKPLSEKMLIVLNSVTAAPFQLDDSGYYIYKTLAAKAAKLGCEIVKIKPFETDNALTAVVATLTMLEINGSMPAHYKDDIDGLYHCFSENNIEQAEQWIKNHVV